MLQPRGLPPAAVLATSVLLCAGGGLTLAFGLSGDAMGSVLPPWLLVPYGTLYLVLAWAVFRGHGWGRVLLLILCGVGAGLAVARMAGDGVLAGLPGLGWPIIYAALVSMPSAKAWFSGAPESAEDAFFDPLRGPREESQTPTNQADPTVRREPPDDSAE